MRHIITLILFIFCTGIIIAQPLNRSTVDDMMRIAEEQESRTLVETDCK